MFPSLEVRWFSPGALPDPIWQWYVTGGIPEEEGQRTDHYLSGVDNTLGIKLREGMVEVKQRIGEHGLVQFAPHISGRVEGWHKWSFPLADGAIPEVSQDLSRGWVPLQKKRWLKVFVFDQGVQQVPLRLNPEAGCSWELSRLHIAGVEESWWSLCFELFGALSGRPDRLAQMVAHVAPPLAELGIDMLSEASYGYPTLLQKTLDNFSPD